MISERVESWLRSHRVFFSIFAVVVGLCILLLTPSIWGLDIVEICGKIRVSVVLPMVVLYFLYLILRTLRLKLLLALHEIRLPVTWLFKIVAKSNLIGQFTIGNIGEATRIAMIKQRVSHSRIRDLVLIFVVEKTSDLATIGLLALCSMFLLMLYSIYITDSVVISVGSGVVFAIGLGVFCYSIHTWRQNTNEVLKAFALTMLSSLAIFCIVVISFLTVTNAAALSIFILHYVSSLVGVLSLIPGGRGAAELTQLSMAVTIFGLNAENTGVAIAQIVAAGYVGSFSAPLIGILVDDYFSRKPDNKSASFTQVT